MHDPIASRPIHWAGPGLTRIPFALYSDTQTAADEQARIFRGETWNYLCLDAELPDSGSYRTTFVGETPVVVVRDEDGEIYAFENRCAHRGALIALEKSGTRRATSSASTTPGATTAQGDLTGVAFEKGVEGPGRHAARFLQGRTRPAQAAHRDLLRPGLRQLQRGRARHRGIPRRRDLRAHRARAAQAGRGHRPLHAGAAEQLEALRREREGHLPREPPAPVLHHLRAQPPVAEGRRDRRRERRPSRELFDDRRSGREGCLVQGAGAALRQRPLPAEGPERAGPASRNTTTA